MTTTTTESPRVIRGFGRARGINTGDDTYYPGAIPAERVIEHIGFPISEGSISATIVDDSGVTTVEDPRRKAVVRMDTQRVLGVFMSGYQIHQPREWCLDNLNLLTDGGLQISTSMVLREGAVVAVQAELPDNREAPGGVIHRPYVLAATSQDGSIATSYATGSTVLACENSLSAILYGNELRHRIRHTSNSLLRVGEVRERLSIIVERVGDQFDEQVRALLDQKVTDQKFMEIVNAYTGVEGKKPGRSLTMAENRVEALRDLWVNDDRVAPWRNTAYGVLSAFNTAKHHVFGGKGDRDERNAMAKVVGDWDSFDAAVVRLLERV